MWCMSSLHVEWWERFEAKSGTSLLVAGVALAGVAVYKTVFFHTPVEVSTVVDIGYGGLALLLTGVALLGLYPHVRDASPRTATAAVASSVLSVIFVTVLWGWLISATLRLGRAPVMPEEVPIWAGLALLGNFITLSVAFVLFAVASRRTAAVPSSASILLVVPALMWLGLIANIAINFHPQNMSILVYVVNAITVGAIGYVIRGRGHGASSRSLATDSSTVNAQVWESLEKWSLTAFFVAGVMFAVAVAVIVVAMVTGEWESLSFVSEAFMAAGWVSSLVGLLGLYPALVDWTHWLARASAVFAVLGMVTLAALAAVSLVAFVVGSQPGTIPGPVPAAVFLPGMLSGTVLAFISSSVASLRSNVHSRTTGILLLVPAALFLMNAFVLPLIFEPAPSGVAPPELALGFASAVTLAMLGIGYRLRTEDMSTDREEQAPETTVG